MYDDIDYPTVEITPSHTLVPLKGPIIHVDNVELYSAKTLGYIFTTMSHQPLVIYTHQRVKKYSLLTTFTHGL